jgi:5'-nucleotidase (lipoprotein e(P4) family)
MVSVRMLPALILGLAVGAAVAYFVAVPRSSETVVEPVDGSGKDDPPYRALDANLYMQISGEYRAACYQTYHFAFARLQEILRTRANDGRQMAIVLDLDETVFDNGAFQARQVQRGLAYSQKDWDTYEQRYGAQVRLVPGAKDFLVAADKLGIALIYISNRNDKNRDQTLATIRRLELPLPGGGDRVKLATEVTGTNKDSRRKEAFDAFDVVMLVGDNLRDFDDKPFRSAVDNTKPDGKTDDPARLDAAVEARFKAVDETRAKFGTTWIILPNPAYGEWTKVLGNGAKDAERLRK